MGFTDSLGQRLAGQLRGSKSKIKNGGNARQQNHHTNRQRTATPEWRSDRQGVSEFRCIGWRNKTAGNLHPCRICFRRSDQPSGTVALDFIQLITIDSKLASALRHRGPAAQPENGKNRSSCHQRDNEPKGHEAFIPRRVSTGGSAAGNTLRLIVTAMCFIAQAHCSKNGLYARAALVSPMTATSAALPNNAAYSRPNTLAQNRTAASTWHCRK